MKYIAFSRGDGTLESAACKPHVSAVTATGLCGYIRPMRQASEILTMAWVLWVGVSHAKSCDGVRAEGGLAGKTFSY